MTHLRQNVLFLRGILYEFQLYSSQILNDKRNLTEDFSVAAIFDPSLRRSKPPWTFFKESFSQVAKKYLNINNKAKSVTPAENKAFQASELPQGHTSLRNKSKVPLKILCLLWNSDDYFVLFCLLFSPPSCREDALKKFNFCLFPCIIGNRKSRTFFFSSLSLSTNSS